MLHIKPWLNTLTREIFVESEIQCDTISVIIQLVENLKENNCENAHILNLNSKLLVGGLCVGVPPNKRHAVFLITVATS